MQLRETIHPPLVAAPTSIVVTGMIDAANARLVVFDFPRAPHSSVQVHDGLDVEPADFTPQRLGSADQATDIIRVTPLAKLSNALGAAPRRASPGDFLAAPCAATRLSPKLATKRSGGNTPAIAAVLGDPIECVAHRLFQASNPVS